jgi:hypothetical protein
MDKQRALRSAGVQRFLLEELGKFHGRRGI